MKPLSSEIMSKQAVWLLDKKFRLCIECEWLVKAEEDVAKRILQDSGKLQGKFLQSGQL